MSTMTDTDVRALFADVCTAWNRGDAAGIAGHYAPEGRLINPFGEVADGRTAIEAVFTELFAGLLAGSTSDIEVDTVRELAPGLLVVDGTQTTSGPLPPLHVTAVVRQTADAAQILECRPYAFVPQP